MMRPITGRVVRPTVSRAMCAARSCLLPNHAASRRHESMQTASRTAAEQHMHAHTHPHTYSHTENRSREDMQPHIHTAARPHVVTTAPTQMPTR